MKNGFNGLKSIYYVLFVLGTTFLMGCVTAQRYTDGSASTMQQCLLINAQELEANGRSPIATFDGKEIRWSAIGKLGMVIPAGVHRITYDAKRSYTVSERSYKSAGTEYTTTTYIPYTLRASVTYDFKPGKNYSIIIEPHLSGSTSSLTSTDPNTIVSINRRNADIIDVDVFVGIEIIEEENGPFNGNTYIGLESQSAWSTGWMYNANFGSAIGPRLGVGIISGALNMKILGEAEVGLAFAFPNMEGVTAALPVFSAGGMLEFNTKYIDFGIGGGIIGSSTLEPILLRFDGKESSHEAITSVMYLSPYVELDIKRMGKFGGVYFQYYPVSETWFSMFGLGIKTTL
ncbi:hypothetical protein FACS189485_02490 [Spirochaetia bacterium]|nr:hypothetical protein FACS189485_02490 [Spirochaetia bacterium]